MFMKLSVLCYSTVVLYYRTCNQYNVVEYDLPTSTDTLRTCMFCEDGFYRKCSVMCPLMSLSGSISLRYRSVASSNPTGSI